MQDDAEELALHQPSALAGRAGADGKHQQWPEMIFIFIGKPPRSMAWISYMLVVSRSINGEQQACLVLFLFYVVLPFQRYSTLFVIFGMFLPTKNISIFSVQHFITVCNIVCANSGNICISIKYMITI